MARLYFPAPIFCAPNAETAESVEDGTRKKKLITLFDDADCSGRVEPATVGNDGDDNESDLD